jgi:hypothetical protein
MASRCDAWWAGGMCCPPSDRWLAQSADSVVKNVNSPRARTGGRCGKAETLGDTTSAAAPLRGADKIVRLARGPHRATDVTKSRNEGVVARNLPIGFRQSQWDCVTASSNRTPDN